MESSKLDPTEVWDRHIEKLKSSQSEVHEVEPHLESVREKRVSSRIRTLYLTSYVPKKGEQQEHIVSIGRTLDVSEGGARIETHRELDKGMQLDLEIAIGDKIIAATGEVLYSEELDDELFATGISFISIDEEDRRFLRS